LRIVVDTNVLLKALIRSSKVRAILLSPDHQFYLPDYAVEEVERHLPVLMEKTGLSEEVRLVLSVLLTNIQVIHSEAIVAAWGEAEEIIGAIDRSDIPFVAASLSTACDGIWSDDKDLKRQGKVRVWNTREMMRLG
jgi:predicted nucleic acid-binding protein